MSLVLRKRTAPRLRLGLIRGQTWGTVERGRRRGSRVVRVRGRGARRSSTAGPPASKQVAVSLGASRSEDVGSYLAATSYKHVLIFLALGDGHCRSRSWTGCLGMFPPLGTPAAEEGSLFLSVFLGSPPPHPSMQLTEFSPSLSVRPLSVSQSTCHSLSVPRERTVCLPPAVLHEYCFS